MKNVLRFFISLIFLITLVSIFTLKVEAADEIEVFFSESTSCAKIDRKDYPADSAVRSVYLCFGIPSTRPITAYRAEVLCDGSSLECTGVEDTQQTDFTTDDAFNITSNTISGRKYITIPGSGRVPEITGNKPIIKINFKVKQTTRGVFRINSANTNITSFRIASGFADKKITNLAINGQAADPVLTLVPNPTVDPSFVAPGTWTPDSDVTFSGKAAARSKDMINWTLLHYKWSELTSGATNPFTSFIFEILKIIFALSVLLVLISAFLMIWTRGKSLTIMRFIPRFFIILLLIAFSFSAIQLIYTTTDILQSFFLKNPDGSIISDADLLNIDFDYKDFVGYRLIGPEYDESAFISLILVKLTALTYFIMSGVLLVRKVILWAFIILSPLFPLLLLYTPIRNTAKIWLGEFFRWLLYAPIFAIFLQALVYFWKIYIPLNFDPSKVNQVNEIKYPTAINILLGGPGQSVTQANSINLPDTFLQYLIALFMLWAVIILPFVLLRIFLDYLFAVSLSESSMMKQFVNTAFPILKYGLKNPPTISPPPIKSPPFAGLARALPFINKLPDVNNLSEQVPVSQSKILSFDKTAEAANKQPFIFSVPQTTNRASLDRTKEILKSINITIPTLRDIVRFETSLKSEDIKKHEEVKTMADNLSKIANPSNITIPSEVHHYNDLKTALQTESIVNKNSFAQSVLNAASSVVERKETIKIAEKLKQFLNPSNISSPQERLQFTEIRDRLVRESTVNNNSFAKSVLSSINNIETVTSKDRQILETDRVVEKLVEEKQKGNSLASAVLNAAVPSVKTASGIAVSKGVTTPLKPVIALPVVNRVQQVSLDDYEAVKEMWTENYQKQDVLVSMTGAEQTRKEWINEDMNKVAETINMLTLSDPKKVEEGMKMVGEILPFLLIGGFSQTEIIAYVKAKLQAAKAVLSEIEKKEEEEETQVEVQKKEEEKGKEIAAENES